MAQTPSQQLDLVATLHYALAGLFGLFSMFPLLHVFAGVAMVWGADHVVQPAAPPQAPPMPEIPMKFGGFMFIGVGVMTILIGLCMTTAIFLAARSLKQRQNFLRCQVLAAVECMMFPFGTALGVFTLITLAKPEVKALFEGEAAPEPVLA